MRLLLLAAMLAGCASPAKRKPCEFQPPPIRLTEDVNRECHKGPLRGHNGILLDKSVKVDGCTNLIEIKSNGTLYNVGHEVGHIIEMKCPEWAKGYYD